MSKVFDEEKLVKQAIKAGVDINCLCCIRQFSWEKANKKKLPEGAKIISRHGDQCIDPEFLEVIFTGH